MIAYEFTLVGAAAVISALGSLLSAIAAYRLAMRRPDEPPREADRPPE